MRKLNIYFRKNDQRWEGRIPKGKREDGTRKFQYILGRTKEDVTEKMMKIYNEEQPYMHCPKTIKELFQEWQHSSQHRVKESTAANYAMKANKHILPAFGDKQAEMLSQDEVYDFIEEKRKKGLSNRYIIDILILLKSIFRYAVGIYHIINPLDGIIMPKNSKTEIQMLDKKEQTVLQQYIAENQNKTTLGIALSMSTGIRIGELCALQWGDIDLEKRILTVKKTIQRIQCPTETARTKLIITEPKSESSRRTIPIPECMMDFLKKFKGNAEEYLISGSEKPTEPRTMQHRFSKILKNVNLPSVHFHSLRHLFATTCVKLGFDVKALSEILGHSSVEITLNRYVHSDFEQKRDYMKLIQLNF